MSITPKFPPTLTTEDLLETFRTKSTVKTHSFFVYKRELRNEYLRNNINLTMIELSRLASLSWKDEPPETKAFYKKLADDAKASYKSNTYKFVMDKHMIKNKQKSGKILPSRATGDADFGYIDQTDRSGTPLQNKSSTSSLPIEGSSASPEFYEDPGTTFADEELIPVIDRHSHATGDTESYNSGALSLEDPVMNSSGSSSTANPNNINMSIIARQQYICSLERMNKNLPDILESTEYPWTVSAYQELIYDFQIVIKSYHSGALSLEDPVMNSSGNSSTANPNNINMNIIARQQFINSLERMNKNLRDILESTVYPGTNSDYQDLICDIQIVIKSYHSGALSLEDPVMNSSGSSSTANPNNINMKIIARQQYICSLERMNKNLCDILKSTVYPGTNSDYQELFCYIQIEIESYHHSWALSLEDPVMNSSVSSSTANPNNINNIIVRQQRYICSLERMNKDFCDLLEPTKYADQTDQSGTTLQDISSTSGLPIEGSSTFPEFYADPETTSADKNYFAIFK
ncbi:17129_t:CDS:1 [Funneliformis geosporum]|uniref:2023_t:CDS:1 n=1 Tax=Funneliformis geosporum TaxID=1117311 RepID=A0A9W4WJL1_9GLOM|nr:17129_t:CDS:1 [Funneliformis geosporum]CAI2166516.1 2023_t:CDS:1 [Funneliformis geosporum]